MQNYLGIVEQARLAVFNREGIPEHLTETAAAYKSFCEEINTRLNQCEEMLRRGYRSEAIRLAETEPNLLELVSLADFPERESFIELCQLLQVDVAPPLALEVASALNEAYSAERSIGQLLRRYRRYALTKAPLKKRLRLLRIIAEVDSGNLSWQKDIDTFEQSRLEEIRKEMHEAVQARNLELLQKLEKELTEERWKTSPPRELVQAVQSSRIQISRSLAREQLQELSHELHEAWSCFNVAEARRVRAAWEDMAAIAQLAPDDPLMREVQPAWEWLRQEEEKEAEEASHREAVSALEYALDREKPLPVLQKLYRQATQGDRNLPGYLERQYQLRVGELEHRAKIRMWRNILVTAFMGIVLIGGAGWGIIIYREHQEYTETVQTLRDLLGTAEKKPPTVETLTCLNQAKTILTQLEKKQPTYLDRAPLPELFAKVNVLFEKETARQKQFRDHTQTAEKELARAKVGLEGIPGASPVDGQTSFSLVETHLQEAELLAISDSEKIKVHQLRKQFTDRKKDWQEKMDREFQSQFSRFEEQFDTLEKEALRSDENLENCLEKLHLLVSELNRLETLSGISTSSQTQLDVLKKKIEELQSTLATRKEEKQHLRQLASLVGRHEDFVKELKRFLEKYPHSSQGKSYERLIQEAPYWEQLDRWNSYAEQWNTQESKKREMILKEDWVKEFQLWKNFPGTAALKEFEPYMKAIRTREEVDIERLQRLLQDPLCQQLWIMKYAEKVYYLLEPKEIKPDTGTGIPYVKDFEMHTQTVAIRPSPSPPKIVPAPHVALSKELLSLLKEAQLGDAWEKNFCAMLEKLLTFPSSEIDPILRLRLLREVLHCGCQGSYPLQEAFGIWHLRIQNAPLELTANWLDPEDPKIYAQRELASKFFQEFSQSEFEQNRQKAADLWKKWRGFRLPEYRWIGVLADTSAQGCRWILKDSSLLLIVRGNVYGIAPTASGRTGSCEVVVLGQVQDEGLPMNPSVPLGGRVVGRPVFAKFSP